MMYAIPRKTFDIIIVNSINSRKVTVTISEDQKWLFETKFNCKELTNKDLPGITLQLSPEDFFTMFKIVKEND